MDAIDRIPVFRGPGTGAASQFRARNVTTVSLHPHFGTAVRHTLFPDDPDAGCGETECSNTFVPQSAIPTGNAVE